MDECTELSTWLGNTGYLPFKRHGLLINNLIDILFELVSVNLGTGLESDCPLLQTDVRLVDSLHQVRGHWLLEFSFEFVKGFGAWGVLVHVVEPIGDGHSLHAMGVTTLVEEGLVS